MPNKKVNPLDKKKGTAFSISRRTNYAFRDVCKELGLSASMTVEELMKNFIRENTKF